MAAYPALPLWTDAYLADTRHLTLEEHGAYLQLLMIAWRSEGCCLPDDDHRLALMLGVSRKKFKTLRPALSDLFSVGDGVWTQKRLTKERRFVEERSSQRRAAAALGRQAKALKVQASGSANESANGSRPTQQNVYTQTQTQTQTQTHTRDKEPSLRSGEKVDDKDAFNGSSVGKQLSINKRGGNGQRGSRIDPEFRPTSEHYALAAKIGIDADSQRERFIDYWRGRSGNGGTKIDWDATFRNWLRSAGDRIRGAQGGGNRSTNEGLIATTSALVAEKLAAQGD